MIEFTNNSPMVYLIIIRYPLLVFLMIVVVFSESQFHTKSCPSIPWEMRAKSLPISSSSPLIFIIGVEEIMKNTIESYYTFNTVNTSIEVKLQWRELHLRSHSQLGVRFGPPTLSFGSLFLRDQFSKIFSMFSIQKIWLWTL